MDISRNGSDVVFRTSFSDRDDLIQIMSGVGEGAPETNNPVNFRLAGLQRKGHCDIWHADQVLSFATDECTPVVINGEDIGGNHGFPCAVLVFAPEHGKTVRDVGSLWRDEAGVLWTLLRVDNRDWLLLISENIGRSDTQFDFTDYISGHLSYLENGQETQAIVPESQCGHVQLTRAIRCIKRDLTCLKRGEWRLVTGTLTDCREARICEEYEIVNPSGVAMAIRKNRPKGGYDAPPSLGQGEAMFLYRMTYRILDDGTILCDFDHQLLQPVRLEWYLGIMYQEKCDLYGGGVWRYIPKLRPFVSEGCRFDFSMPYNTAGQPMPRSFSLTPDVWTNPASPPDRQIDFIARENGTYLAAFAGGFLPCFDGAPEYRARHITDAGEIVRSVKTYPTFAGGKKNVLVNRENSASDGFSPLNLASLRGVGYRKYFLPPPEGENACYTVEYAGITYLYMDFFSRETKRLQYDLQPGTKAVLLECAAGVSFECSERSVIAQGTKGFAVFQIEA